MKKNTAWREALKNLAGGVNSPVRAFKAVRGEPIFMRQGLGPYLFDSSGKRYIDYCLSWGAILLGHAHADTVRAIEEQAARGTSFGTATEYETSLAKLIKKAFPGMEKIRFTSSGTEAAMSALRLARGITGREVVLKFEGCYHGHADSFLAKAGSGVATLGIPGSAGVPKSLAALTATLPYNDTGAVRNFFKKRSGVACAIVEPVAGNMGVIPASKEFLSALRDETRKAGALLIFDEVITGFRVGYGGVQHLLGIQPDLTILGKIIGGGLPVGALGGSTALMNRLAPLGNVYQAGTLSGNPLSMAAGASVLSRLSDEFYVSLREKCDDFLSQARRTLLKSRAICVQSAGTMFHIFFGGRRPKNFKEASSCDAGEFKKVFHRLVSLGVYFPPSAFEACFVSFSHTGHELDQTLEAFKKC